MKRYISIMAVAMLLLGLGACKAAKEPQAEPASESASPAPEQGGGEEAASYGDELIFEEVLLEGEYDDDCGNHVVYSYHVPQLDCDSEDASAINDEIMDKFGGYVNDELVAIGSKTSLVCYSVSWESFWHDSILCLVVKAQTDWDFDDYSVYSFDFDSEKAVGGTELAAMAGIGEDELLQKASAAAAAAFDSAFEGMPQDDFLSQQRDWTLSPENINSDMLLYLNDSDNICLVLPIGSLAGGAWYYHVLELEN